MNTYTVTGHRNVAGRHHGDLITEAELTNCNISALIQGGHIAQNPTKPVKAETQEEK